MKSQRLAATTIALGAIVGLATSSAQLPSRSVWDGVYTEDQAKRGGAFYAQECSTCHGSDLTGSDEVPSLFGDRFMSNWNGLTVGDLLERIRVSMPQDDPNRLSRQQKTDIVAYLLSFNKFPPGKTELARDSQALKEIQLEATKP